MAGYKPTLADIPEENYTPSLGDISSVEEQPSQNVSNMMVSNNPQVSGFLKYLLPNMAAGYLQGSQDLLNAPSNIARYLQSNIGKENTIAGKIGLNAQSIPRQDVNFSELLNIPEQQRNQYVQAITGNIPAFGLPELKLPALATPGVLPGVTRALSTSLGRILPQMGYGAISNENPAKGAEEFGLGQALVESLPLGLKFARGSASLLEPSLYTQELVKALSENYKKFKDLSSSYYDKVLNKYGKENVYKEPSQNLLEDQHRIVGDLTPQYKKLDQETIDKYFPEKVKKLHEVFMNEPTLQNAHNLQKQIGLSEAQFRRLKYDPYNDEVADSLRYARQLLNKDTKDMLKATDPEALEDWNKAIDIHRESVAPYRSNATLNNIAKGNIKTITPKKLSNALTKVTEYEEPKLIPDNHYIREAQSSLNNRIQGSKAFKELLPQLGRMSSPNVTGFFVNPAIQKLGIGIHPYYDALAKSLMLYGSDQQGS